MGNIIFASDFKQHEKEVITRSNSLFLFLFELELFVPKLLIKQRLQSKCMSIPNHISYLFPYMIANSKGIQDKLRWALSAPRSQAGIKEEGEC